jgi:fatty acid desaturase
MKHSMPGTTLAEGGQVTTVPRVQGTGKDDYPELVRQVRDAGLFHHSARRSVAKAVLVGLVFAAGWAALFFLGDSWYQLPVAAYLGVAFGQVGFLGHSAGHRQIFCSRRLNDLVGLACANLGTGISYGYWVDKHNRHHSHPNQVGSDPDVGPGVISWTTEQAAVKTGLGRAIAKHQAALFLPLVCLEALNLHISSARSLRTSVVRRKPTEIALLVAHATFYVGAVFVVLSPLRAVAFLVVQQGVFGFYLGCAFAPNHKGMTMPAPGQKLDFLCRQVTTSRNVKGRRALDIAMGGLNYQIEHHLFPSMPMANLRRCQPIVRAYCLAHGIDYCESSLAGSYLATLRHLRRAGRLVPGPAVGT